MGTGFETFLPSRSILIGRKNCLRRKEKIIFCSHGASVGLFAGRGPVAGLFREQTFSLPHCSWSPWVTDADTVRKPTGGGKWGRMLIRAQITEVNRQPTDVYHNRSILKHLTLRHLILPHWF